MSAHPDAGRNDAYPDPYTEPGAIDIEPFLDLALEDAVDTIMRHGRYPARGAVMFDLLSWVLDSDSINERKFYVAMLTDRSRDGAAGMLYAERSRFDALLTENLRDSDIVRARAMELATEGKE